MRYCGKVNILVRKQSEGEKTDIVHLRKLSYRCGCTGKSAIKWESVLLARKGSKMCCCFTLPYLLREQVSMSISSSALRRISSSATDPVATSAKGKDRRTLATSSELDKKRGAWPSAGLLRNAGLLRLVLLTKTFLLFSVALVYCFVCLSMFPLIL